MENRTFLNNDVSRITGVTPRQVLAWTEKSIITPFKETTGAGVKREYDYVNLLEIYLCRHLLLMGFGIQHIKNTLNNLRYNGNMREWANNFGDYYLTEFNKTKKLLKNQIVKLTKEKGSKDTLDILKKIFKNYDLPRIPDKPVGLLMIFYSYQECENHILVPWNMNYALNLNYIQESFNDSVASVTIDLGKIKSSLDAKLKE